MTRSVAKDTSMREPHPSSRLESLGTPLAKLLPSRSQWWNLLGSLAWTELSGEGSKWSRGQCRRSGGATVHLYRPNPDVSMMLKPV